MRKCTIISPYMRRPLIIYDFATAPIPYIVLGKFDFLFISVVGASPHAKPPCVTTSETPVSLTTTQNTPLPTHPPPPPLSTYFGPPPPSYLHLSLHPVKSLNVPVLYLGGVPLLWVYISIYFSSWDDLC
jgi:hypothetical protein